MGYGWGGGWGWGRSERCGIIGWEWGKGDGMRVRDVER